MNRDSIISHAYDIAEEYINQDMTLTVRQMYYQFVARGLLGSGQKIYQRIVGALTQARLDGRFPIDWIEDRGRRVGETDTERLDNVETALDDSARRIYNHPYWLLRYGRWYGQPEKVFVWIEKEALAGVLEKNCNDLGVGLFPCKGYPSVSAISSWVSSTYEAMTADDEVDDGAEKAVIIYLGDHDPDGLQIPVSAGNLIRDIQNIKEEPFDFEIRRVALTMGQIRQYNPPPFAAKTTSSRYATYVRDTGTTDAWELDALEPTVLRDLVVQNVEAHFDRDVHALFQSDIRSLRTEMREAMQDPDWIRSAIGG